MVWFSKLRSLFGQPPIHEAAGRGRRALAWMPGNPGAVAALLATNTELRSKSRDLVRRNAWAQAGIEAFVANAIGTGIKPQSMLADQPLREAIHSLWWDWCEEADAAGLTDFYGLQALACRAMLEGGECLVRLRYRRPEDGLPVGLQLQLLEPEHLPATLNQELASGNVIRAGIEFDKLGRRVAYHLYRSHPGDGSLAPMSGTGGVVGGLDTVRVPASEIIHLFRPLRPGQIRGEPWLARALGKLNELDQYDDAELDRKKVAAMFVGFVRRPERDFDNGNETDDRGEPLLPLEPGQLQILDDGEDITFSTPADVGGNYESFQYRTLLQVAAALGLPYANLSADMLKANYSNTRAALLEFRRRIEAFQHSVLVFQLCRAVWARWMDTAVLSGSLDLPDYEQRRADYLDCSWLPPRWDWVDPLKDIRAEINAIEAGLKSRTQAIAERGFDAAMVDAEIAGDHRREDSLGLSFGREPVPAPTPAPPPAPSN